MTFNRHFSKAILITSLLMFTSLAAAGNGGSGLVVIYGPFGAASAIPVLGGAGLIILALLFSVIAVRMLKNQSHQGSAWLIVATFATVIATAGSGIKIISDANAVVPATITMTNPAGGTLNSDSFGCLLVNNGTAVTQQIIQMSANAGIVMGSCGNGGISTNGGGSYQGTCSDSPSTALNAGDFCDVYIQDEV